eukprot:gene2765-2704_t
MRIHVTFIDRVGITQEVLALLGGRSFNLDAVEMVPPNVYIDAPTLGAEVLEELREALFGVRGVQAVTLVDILPGQRRRLQLDALLAASSDPVLAVDDRGHVLLANPALIALCGREPAGESLSALFDDADLQSTLIAHHFRLPMHEVSLGGHTLLLDAMPITDAGALLTLYQPNRIGERLSALHHDHAEGFDALLGESPPIRSLKARAQRHFMQQACAQIQRPVCRLAPSTFPALLGNRWPGNVRQLQNVIFRAAAICESPLVDIDDLDIARTAVERRNDGEVGSLEEAVEGFERKLLEQLYQSYPSSRLLAARL